MHSMYTFLLLLLLLLLLLSSWIKIYYMWFWWISACVHIFIYIYIWTKINCCACREKLLIPYDKPYIILKGVAKTKTLVEWGDHDNLAQSPTFTSQADHIVAKSISFRVRYHYPLIIYKVFLISYTDID